MGPNEVNQICKTLNIPDNIRNQFLEKPTQENLDKLKEEAKRCWKRAAFELHPDRGGDAEEFKQALAQHETLQALRLPSPHMLRPRQVRQSVVVIHVGYTGYSTTTSYTSTGGNWTVW